MKKLWLDDEDYPKGGCFIAAGREDEYETIAEMMGGDELSNAEFIIKACNNYEKMKDFIIQYLASEHNICRPDHFACQSTPEQLRYKAEEILKDL